MAKFLIRSIAKLADASGMFRVRVSPVSETMKSKEEAETLIYFQDQKAAGFPVEILEVSDAEWAAALDGSMCGYAKSCDLESKWAPSPSIYEVRQPGSTADLVDLNID